MAMGKQLIMQWLEQQQRMNKKKKKAQSPPGVRPGGPERQRDMSHVPEMLRPLLNQGTGRHTAQPPPQLGGGGAGGQSSGMFKKFLTKGMGM